MASTTTKQICAKCNKGGGIAMCNGCQQSFCIRHFAEHRVELSQQIESLGQEHDLLRRDLSCEENAHPLLERIHQWEQESVRTIQECAREARLDLQELLERNKHELRMSVNRFTEELRTCRETDDFTEIDINKWTEQLKELRQTIESALAITIEYDNNKTPALSLIKISAPQQSLISPFSQENQQKENNNQPPEQSVANVTEKFTKFYGNILLSSDGSMGVCIDSRWNGSCVSGIGRYSCKKHHICLQVETKNSEYLFFGIITASQQLTSSITEARSAYGWWEFDRTVVNGRTSVRGQNKLIKSGDNVALILDCDNRRIQFHHQRTNMLVDIPVDLEQCPFPWKIIVRLDSSFDSIRILV